jgi:uncharacterized membrane protein
MSVKRLQAVINIKKGSKMEKKDFEKNVVVAVFKVESEGYQALSELSQAAAGDTYLVSAAALVKKTGNACFYLDGFDTGAHTANDAAIGGLIGMTVGILAGPLGVLLGGSYGALVGATVDAGDAVFGASMLDQMADKLDDGMVALIALAAEETPAVLDAKLGAYDTVIARFDADAVADEVDKAYEKQAEMARLAKIEVREKEKAEFEAQMEENSEILRHGFSK